MTLFNYWWSSIKGNLPEDLTSLIVVGLVTGIFVPRVRRWWVAREQALHAKLDLLHEKADHIIRESPDIGEFHPKDEQRKS